MEPAIAGAERAPRPGPPVDVLGTFETKSSFLRAAHLYLRGDVTRAHALAVEARDGAAPMSDGLASMLIGLTAYFGGDAEGALEPLEHARVTLSGVGFVQALLTTLGVLATIKSDAGETAVAERCAAEAERLADEFGLAEAPTASLPNASRGMLLERMGDLDGAVAAYERAALLARRGGWPLDLAHALLLHAALKRRRRDYAGARELTREAGQALAPCNDAGVLVERLARIERSLGARRRDRRSAADGELSDREIDDPAAAGHRPLAARDRRQALRLLQHRQEPHARGVPQARRQEPRGRGRARARARPAVANHPG